MKRSKAATTLGVQEDKPEVRYHHRDLRRALLAAARDEIERHGTESLSLRGLCRCVGVSPTAPYRHFDTKNCLLAAIAEEGFNNLVESVHQRLVDMPADPIVRLTALGQAYVEFARDNPVDYRLMFGSVLLDFSGYEGLRAAASRAFEILSDLLQQGITQGKIVDRPLLELSGMVWAAVHGIASLMIDKHPAEGEIGQRSPAMQATAGLRADPRAAIELIFIGIQPRH